MRRLRIVGTAWSFALLSAGVSAAQGQAPAQSPPRAQVEACAQEQLTKMSNFLARQQRFTVNTERSSDVVEQGQQKTVSSRGRVAVQRPNKLRVDREGDSGPGGARGSGSAFYDGKQFSVMQKGAQAYATTPAPPTIDALMDQTEEALGWVPPGADLISSDPRKVLEEHVKAGRCLEDGRIGNTPVKRLAFEGPNATWQISIQDGAQPLPLELVITPKDDPQLRRQTLTLTNWNLSPKFDATEFAFAPPQGAKKVPFLRAPSAPPQPPAAQGRKGSPP